MRAPTQKRSQESLQCKFRLRRKHRRAAEAYNLLLAENDEERLALDEWESSNLAATPKGARN
jgi:hypothetical protein